MNPSRIQVITILPDQLVKVYVQLKPIKYHLIGDAVMQYVRININGLTFAMLAILAAFDSLIQFRASVKRTDANGFAPPPSQWVETVQPNQPHGFDFFRPWSV
jgi:hypothetical protein